MASVTVTSPDLQALVQKLVDLSNELLTVAGERALQHARQDFVTKSRGSAGTDGVQWQPTGESGIRARAKRRPDWAANMSEWREASQQEQRILDEYRQDGRFPTVSSAGSRGRQKAIVGAILAADSEYQDVRDEMRSLKRQRESLVDQQRSGRTGVDSGKLEAALNRGDENNVFELQGDVLTIGVSLPHAQHFDRKRSLLPDDLPEQWRSDIEAELQVRLNDELQDLLR